MKLKNLCYSIVLVPVLFVLAASCSRSTEKQGQVGESQDKTPAEALSGDEFANVSDGNEEEIMKGYLDLKDALVETQLEKARQSAEKLAASLADTKSGGILAGALKDVKNIQSSTDVEEARRHFNTLSQKIYHFAKIKKLNMTLYKQYCPMAFNNKGAFWLSSKEEVKNPYFGDRMLRCGTVQEKL